MTSLFDHCNGVVKYSKKYGPSTPTLKDLYSIQIRKRIELIILLLNFKYKDVHLYS